MANTQGAASITLPVALATVLDQYQFVAINNTGSADDAAENGKVAGVALVGSTNASSAAIPVATANGGRVKVLCGGAITAGALVGVDDNSHAKTAISAATAVGEAVEAGADGRVISIVLFG